MEVEYRNPAATADVILENEREEILLIQRGADPYKGLWAIPGGHVDYNLETVENAGMREMKEETGLICTLNNSNLIGVYSEPSRDPRDHYITHVYATKDFEGILKADDDASDARWFSLRDLPALAFDHARILNDYMARRDD